MHLSKKILLFLALAAALLLVFLNKEEFSKENIEALLVSLGAWAPLAFITVYVVAASLMVPATPLLLLGGFLFGPLWGFVYSIIAATIAAMLTFLFARYFAAEWVESHVHGAFAKLKHGVEKEGWKCVALARLIPILPYTFLNYAFGVTKISFKEYAITSFFAMMPSSLAYVYLGHFGMQAGTNNLIMQISLVLGLLIFVSFIPKVFAKPRDDIK